MRGSEQNHYCDQTKLRREENGREEKRREEKRM